MCEMYLCAVFCVVCCVRYSDLCSVLCALFASVFVLFTVWYVLCVMRHAVHELLCNFDMCCLLTLRSRAKAVVVGL